MFSDPSASGGTDAEQDLLAFTLEYIQLRFSQDARVLYFNAPPSQSKTLSISQHISGDVFSILY